LVAGDLAAPPPVGILHTPTNGVPFPHHTGTICWTALLTGGEGKDLMETPMIKPMLLVDESEFIK